MHSHDAAPVVKRTLLKKGERRWTREEQVEFDARVREANRKLLAEEHERTELRRRAEKLYEEERREWATAGYQLYRRHQHVPRDMKKRR